MLFRSQDHKDNQEKPEQQVPLDYQDFLVQLVQQAHQAQLVQLAHQAQQVQLELQDHKGQPAQKENLE